MRLNKINRLTGFTLIEVMIAMAIVAILSSIAIPAYSNYIIRGKLITAQAMLSSYAASMQQYYADNRNYGSVPSCAIAAPTDPNFVLTCQLASPSLFVATVGNVANAGMGGANSYAYSVNQDSAKTTASFAGKAINASGWQYK